MKRKGSIAKITSKFPQPGTVKEIQGGFNYIYLGQTYSFYYNEKSTKSNRMVHNGNVYLFLPGAESDCLEGLLKAIPEPLTSPQSASIAKAVLNHHGIGAQACIDHITRKIELIKQDSKRDNNRIITLLTALKSELKQYL